MSKKIEPTATAKKTGILRVVKSVSGEVVAFPTDKIAPAANPQLVVFPGTFDPITYGHMDIACRAAHAFGRVIIAMPDSSDKATLFSLKERVSLINDCFRGHELQARIDVRGFSGLLVDYVKKCRAKIIVRGLRAISDYDYESQIALTNKQLAPEIETVFLVASLQYTYVSSSIVRQVGKLGGALSALVPQHVERAMRAKFKV